MPAKFVLIAALLALLALNVNGQAASASLARGGGGGGGRGGRNDGTGDEPGCCYGADANCETDSKSACDRMAERRGCEWRSGDDADCTFVVEPIFTTTSEQGCCKGDSVKSNPGCIRRDSRAKCERSSSCHFIVDGTLEDECAWPTTTSPTTTTTIDEPGCCKGDSFRSNAKCNAHEGRERCEKSSSCHFVSGGVVEVDCAVDFGCCISHYILDCFGIEGQANCVSKAGCLWIEATNANDCSLDGTLEPHTSTSEPWLIAKEESAVLFDGKVEVSNVTDAQVSLSTLLLLAVVAFAVYQLYKWWNANRDGYTKVTSTDIPQQTAAAYQMA